MKSAAVRLEEVVLAGSRRSRTIGSFLAGGGDGGDSDEPLLYLDGVTRRRCEERFHDTEP